MKDLTIEEKIAEIKNTNSYQDVKNSWFPPYHEKEYYFVSYSHKDYKLVYESLYRLQNGEKRLNLWYDHNLTPGRDWEIEARRYIYDFNCKGVIFFVSENAVLSQSIHREIEFVKNSGKSYLSINLPCNKIEGHIGEYLSAAKMLELLKQQGYVIENYEEKSAVLTETFNDKVTFLPLNEDIDSQITKILSLKREPLLNIDDGTVISINDINALEIKREDFIYYDKDNKLKTANGIGASAFANCKYLRKIELPQEMLYIENLAFYNCKSLIKINLHETFHLGDNVFKECTNLERIDVNKNNLSYSSLHGILYNKKQTRFIHIPQSIKGKIVIPNSITSIDDNAFEHCTKFFIGIIGDMGFRNCTSLERVAIGKNVKIIGDMAFYNCTNLKEIIIPNGVTSIGMGAFQNCTNLTNILIPDSVKSIGEMAFDDCAILTSITIPDSVTSFARAFWRCKNLKDIFYDGTRQQWQEIKKDKNWDYGTPDYTVHCTDGDLKKGEF